MSDTDDSLFVLPDQAPGTLTQQYRGFLDLFETEGMTDDEIRAEYDRLKNGLVSEGQVVRQFVPPKDKF